MANLTRGQGSSGFAESTENSNYLTKHVLSYKKTFKEIEFGDNTACLHISEDLVNSFETNDLHLPALIQQVWRHTNGNLVNSDKYKNLKK